MSRNANPYYKRLTRVFLCTSGYDARMSRRFQFNLKRMAGSLVLFSVAMWLARMAFNPADDNVAAFIAFPMAIGAGIGQLFGRPIVGCLIVAALLIWTFFASEMLKLA